jgi:hypothetical protein
MVVQKEKDEMEYLAKYNFSPEISAMARRMQPTKIEALHSGEKASSRFPIREKRDAAKAAERHDKDNCHLTFKPQINGRSKDIFRMVHECSQEQGTRLAYQMTRPRLMSRASTQTQEDPSVLHTPQITVRAVQKGFERSGEDVFHRLHHGPPHKAVFKDPASEKTDEERVHNTTEHLLKCKKPHGISEKAWGQVKEAQKQHRENFAVKRAAQEFGVGASPTSTRFGALEDNSSPGSPDTTLSPNDLKFSARSTAPTTAPGTGRASLTSSVSGINALAGKLRQSMSIKEGDQLKKQISQVSPASTSFPAQSSFGPTPSQADFTDMESPGQSPGADSELEWSPQHTVSGNTALMGLLGRCDQVVKMKSPSPES